MHESEQCGLWRMLFISMVLLIVGLAGTVSFAGNIDPVNDGSQFAYGENTGWINF